MSVEEKIAELNRFLKQQKDPRFLNMVMAMKEAFDDDGTERISIEQYNAELDAAEEEYSNGEFITQEELEKKANQW